jgi:hypothetical protein
MLEARTNTPFIFEPTLFSPKNCSLSPSEFAKTFSTRSNYSGKVSSSNGVLLIKSFEKQLPPTIT